MQAPWWWSKTEICRSHIYGYFNENFNVFFKLIKVHLLVSELYIYQKVRCNDKNCGKQYNNPCFYKNQIHWEKSIFLRGIKWLHGRRRDVQTAVFWVMTPCSIVDIYRQLDGPAHVFFRRDEWCNRGLLANIDACLPEYMASQGLK